MSASHSKVDLDKCLTPAKSLTPRKSLTPGKRTPGKSLTPGKRTPGKSLTPGKLKRRASVSAESSRTAWCPVILKTNSCLEVHMLWKDSRNGLKLYEKDKKVFGRVMKAVCVKEKNKKEVVKDYFKILDDMGDEIHFETKIFSPALIGSNVFSKKMIELRCQENGDAKIAKYIENLTKSEGFSHFERDLDLNFATEDAENEFNDFYEAACAAATPVTLNKEEAVNELAKKTNRKRKTNGKVTAPKNKQSKLEKYFNHELRDQKGVEKQHVEGFRARADVHIDCLDVCADVLLPIDDLKVKVLAKDMMERFDPALVTLTVVPADPEAFAVGRSDSTEYVVVHGRHRLLALKWLKSQNKLAGLPMMMREELTCYILGVTAAPGLTYASLRGNEIGAKFAAKPNHHDVTKIIAGLVETLKDNEKVYEVVSRYVNLLKYSEVLKTAIRSICKWPLDCLQLLSKIVTKFELYQTLDTDTKQMQRSNKKLMEGIKQEMPIGLFKEVARLPLEMVRDNADSIVNGSLSVKMLVKEFLTKEERRKKVAKIEEISGFQSIVNLRNTYPEKFSEEIVDKLPPVRSSSDKPYVEVYTKTVIEEVVNSDTSEKEIQFFEAEKDIQEVKRLLKYVRRSNVKTELMESINRFEIKKNRIFPATDPYDFPPAGSKSFKMESKILESAEEVSAASHKRKKVDPTAAAKLDVKPVVVSVEGEERYRHFIHLLHKCSAVNHQSHASLQIDTIRSFFANAEESNPFAEAEIDTWLEKMVEENKVMRSEDTVFFI